MELRSQTPSMEALLIATPRYHRKGQRRCYAIYGIYHPPLPPSPIGRRALKGASSIACDDPEQVCAGPTADFKAQRCCCICPSHEIVGGKLRRTTCRLPCTPQKLDRQQGLSRSSTVAAAACATACAVSGVTRNSPCRGF